MCVCMTELESESLHLTEDVSVHKQACEGNDCQHADSYLISARMFSRTLYIDM